MIAPFAVPAAPAPASAAAAAAVPAAPAASSAADPDAPQLGVAGKVYGLTKRGGREVAASGGGSLGPSADMVASRRAALARQAEAGSAGIGGLRAAKAAQSILGLTPADRAAARPAAAAAAAPPPRPVTAAEREQRLLEMQAAADAHEGLRQQRLRRASDDAADKQH